jgi:hypothetical protein
MSQIPSVTTLKTEDFPSEQSWIGNLFLPLNDFLTSVVGIINGNVLFGDNIPTQTQTLTVKPGTQLPLVFKYTLKPNPTELRVCRATKNGSPIALLTSWSISSGQISFFIAGEVSNGVISAPSSTSTYSIVVRINP